MKAENILDMITGYEVVGDVKPEKEVIPRFTNVIYSLMETTGKIPSEASLVSLYESFSEGVIRYNLHRAIRNIYLCFTLNESEVDLPPIDASSGSADFVMAGVPFAICLTEKQYEELSDEFKQSVNCIVLEDYKSNIETVNGFILFKDISAIILNVAEKIREMIQKAQEAEEAKEEDAEEADTGDTVSKEGE